MKNKIDKQYVLDTMSNREKIILDKLENEIHDDVKCKLENELEYINFVRNKLK